MISVSTHDDVGLIELNRPERRNALDIATCRQLVDAAAEVRAAGARAVVVAGNGPAFCSGADFGEVYTDEFLDALYSGLHAVADLPMPTVAAVTGPAIGGGLQLALACDLRVAAPEAVFGLPTARLGLAVDPWTIERLVQIGRRRHGPQPAAGLRHRRRRHRPRPRSRRHPRRPRGRTRPGP